MITTHVLDTRRGRPAGGLTVTLAAAERGGWRRLAEASTGVDGRIDPLGEPVDAGVHRLVFDTGGYFAALGEETFYPEVVVVFTVRDPVAHLHVPLLVSAYGYTTYRGS